MPYALPLLSAAHMPRQMKMKNKNTKLFISDQGSIEQNYSKKNKVNISKKPFLNKIVFYLLLCATIVEGHPVLALSIRQENSNYSFSDTLKKKEVAFAKTISTIKKSKELSPTKKGSKGVYAISGIGTALPIGTGAQILSSKVSTSLGLNIGLGTSSFFLYPSADLLVFKYNQHIKDPQFPLNTENFRASFTTFSLMLAQKNRIGNLGIYPFAGPGLSLIKEPRVRMDEGNNVVMEGRKTHSATFKGGLGLDYSIGAFTLFVEGSYIYNFKSVQERNIEAIPVFGGLKSDVSTIFRRKHSPIK